MLCVDVPFENQLALVNRTSWDLSSRSHLVMFTSRLNTPSPYHIGRLRFRPANIEILSNQSPLQVGSGAMGSLWKEVIEGDKFKRPRVHRRKLHLTSKRNDPRLIEYYTHTESS